MCSKRLQLPKFTKGIWQWSKVCFIKSLSTSKDEAVVRLLLISATCKTLAGLPSATMTSTIFTSKHSFRITPLTLVSPLPLSLFLPLHLPLLPPHLITLTLSTVVPTSLAHLWTMSVLRRWVEVMPHSSKYLSKICRCSSVNSWGSGW